MAAEIVEDWRYVSAFLVLLIAGCGGGGNPQGRLPFSGNVTLDGQALKGGYLILEPKSGQKTQSGGMIHEGRFEVPQNKGAAPGLYAVAIYSGDTTQPPSGVSPGTPEYEVAMKKVKTRGEQVPTKYNTKTTLTAELKVDGENEFTFDLTTK